MARYRIAERAGDNPLRFVLATEGLKDDGLDLRMDRVDLDRYRRNPVLMSMHNWSTWPIGRVTDLEVDGGRLLGTLEFDEADPAAAEVGRKVRDGFISAVSIGFDASGARAGVPDSWTLLETSVVPIPLDPDALLESGRTAGEIADLVVRRLRALGRSAIAAHDADVTDEEWDGPAAVADAPNDREVLRWMHAWVDPDGDPDAKASYKFPHHAAGADTAANLPAVRNGLARLPQADIPEEDRDGVERHLRAHLDDTDRSPVDDPTPRRDLAAILDREMRSLDLEELISGA